MTLEKLKNGLSRSVLIGTDVRTSISVLTSAVSILAVYVMLELAYQRGAVPSAGEYAHVAFAVLGTVLGAVGLYSAVSYELNHVVRGVVFGISVFAVVGALLSVLSVTGMVGDDAVIAGVLVSLFVLVTVHSYFNRGILTCWLVASIPIFGVLAAFFYVHGGSFGREYTAIDAVVRSIAFTVPAGIVIGTAGFVSGVAIWRTIPVSSV